MPHRKMTQISGVRHVEQIAGSHFEHNPHQTAHGIEAAVERERELAGLRKHPRH